MADPSTLTPIDHTALTKLTNEERAQFVALQLTGEARWTLQDIIVIQWEGQRIPWYCYSVEEVQAALRGDEAAFCQLIDQWDQRPR